MSQAWLNVIGLTFDFIGVVLLSYEWWIALSSERRESEILSREEMLKPNPMLPRSGLPQQAVFDFMNEQQRFRQRQARAAAARGARWQYYLTALLLVGLGFLLQVAGSWPGCCQTIGILPGSAA